MKNDSFLPDNQFLHLRLDARKKILLFALAEYDDRLRKTACVVELMTFDELKNPAKQAVRLELQIELIGEYLEKVKRQRKTILVEQGG